MVDKISELFRGGREAVTSEARALKVTISIILMLMLGVVVTLSTLDLGLTIIREIVEPPFILIRVDNLQHLLGLFLHVLIALELFDSVRAYLRHRHFYVETVVLVSILAVARKAIVLDVHELSGLTIIAIAALFIALCGGYLLLRRCPPRTRQEEEQFEERSR